MRALIALAVLLAGLVACTPALDWRESRPQGSQVQLLFPCKPASHSRRVALAGGTIEMSMYACSAADTVYALSFADVKEPSRVGPALDELARAVNSNVQSSSAAASEPVRVAGMTPHPRSAQWRLVGRLPDGRAVQERAALFTHGTSVYQATMLGAELDKEAQENFFGSLRVGS
jgi:hypothetical protein